MFGKALFPRGVELQVPHYLYWTMVFLARISVRFKNEIQLMKPNMAINQGNIRDD